MKWNGYIIFGKQRSYPHIKARLTKTEPRLEAGEILIKLSAMLPNELFQRPILEANIDIPKELIPQSIIDVDIQNNIQQAVKEAIGVDIAFNIVEQDGSDKQ